MENYVQLHDDGYTPKEIAKQYNLSVWTVYERLNQIAEQSGRSRESLLERVVIADHSGRNYTPVKPIDRTGFEKNYNDALRKLEELIEMVKITAEVLEEEIKHEESNC